MEEGGGGIPLRAPGGTPGPLGPSAPRLRSAGLAEGRSERAGGREVSKIPSIKRERERECVGACRAALQRRLQRVVDSGSDCEGPTWRPSTRPQTTPPDPQRQTSSMRMSSWNASKSYGRSNDVRAIKLVVT